MLKPLYMILSTLAPLAAVAQGELTGIGQQQVASGQTGLTSSQLAQPVHTSPHLRFGYLSYDAAIKAMPGYAEAQQNLASLRAQYEAETKRSEDEFNEKYEEFLAVQQELDGPILRKRQSELQELLDKGVSFKAEAKRLLRQAEADMYAPLRTELDAMLRKVGQERGYAFILNTDGNALPFVDKTYGEDITELVVQLIMD